MTIYLIDISWSPLIIGIDPINDFLAIGVHLCLFDTIGNG